MKTNILRTLLLLMGLFFSLSLKADVTYEGTGHLYNGIYYEFSEEMGQSVAHVVGYDEELTDVVIPDSLVIHNHKYIVTIIVNPRYWGPFYGKPLRSIKIGNNIRSIPGGTFEHCPNLISVTIGNSVTSIGAEAFLNCSNLTSVNIPDGVTYIGFKAFSGCSSLKSVTIPNSIPNYNSAGEGLMDDAFEGCSSLSSVTFHSRVIEKWFNGIKSIKEITIGNEVQTIKERAFGGCAGLTSVTIPNSVTTIESGAFAGTGLTSVTIPNSVTRIENSTFQNCRSLTSVTIPNSVTSICDYAFWGCSSLSSVTIPNSVTSIRDYAFSGCSGLSSLTIPNSVKRIDDTAFLGCSGLSSIVVESDNPTYDSRDNCNAIIQKSLNRLIIGCKNTVIPQSVTWIGGSAFSYDTPLFIIPNHIITVGGISIPHLKTLIVGSGVEDLRSSLSADKIFFLPSEKLKSSEKLNCKILFQNNSVNNSYMNPKVYPYLNSRFEVDGMVYVPVNPSERTCDIVDYRNYNSIHSVDIKESVEYNGIAFSVNEIAPFSFYNYDNIKDLKLNVNGAIGNSAFSECHSLSSVEFGNNVTSINEGAFKSCDALASLKFGNSIASIETSAFSNCSSLKFVDIPNSVTSIGKYAFQNCSGLNSAKISDNLEIINDSTFFNCISLNNIEIGEKVNIIENGAFRRCSSLESIVIPQSVTVLGSYAFGECKSLRKLVFERPSSDKEQSLKFKHEPFSSCPLDSVYLGRELKDFYILAPKTSSPFYENKTLRAVYITDNVDEISENEFYGCTNLKRISGGEGLTKVGKKAFSGCSSLESFTFGKDMVEIGQQAFEDCVGITMLVCKAATPPNCKTSALTNINKWNCTLYVPANSISLYQAADQWKDFFFIDTIDHFLANVNSVQDQPVCILASNGLISVSNVEEGQRVAVYLVDGRQMASTTAKNGTAQIVANVNRSNMIIVKIGSKVHKIMMQ